MLLLVFVFGLLVGSFLNVCIYRIPKGESIIFPPSRCPSCDRRLGVTELIPVVSWLWQRGRCRGCGSAVSWRYPLVELATALLYVLLFLHFPGTAFLVQAVFYSGLLVVFLIDYDHQIIPNRLVLFLTVYALVVQVISPAILWSSAFFGALLGGGLLLLLAVVSRGGMGGGDIKLMTVLGFWFGWQQVILLLFLSFLFGGFISIGLLLLGLKKRKDGVAFGPFIVMAAFVVGLWGSDILTWYLGI